MLCNGLAMVPVGSSSDGAARAVVHGRALRFSRGRGERARETLWFRRGATRIDTVRLAQFAFAYGSGVLGQKGYDHSHAAPSDLPMLDVVLAVRDPLAWHRANLARNPRHYSAVGACVNTRATPHALEPLSRCARRSSRPAACGPSAGGLRRGCVLQHDGARRRTRARASGACGEEEV